MLVGVDFLLPPSLLRQAYPIKKNQLIQVMHDWQNVGRQKGKFRDARLMKISESTAQATIKEKNNSSLPKWM